MSAAVLAFRRPQPLADVDVLDRRERARPLAPARTGPRGPGAWTRFVARMQFGPVGPGTAWIDPSVLDADAGPSSAAPGRPAGPAIAAAAVAAGHALARASRAAGEVLAAPWRAWRRERRIAAGIAALRELDDRMLRDLGLERADIARAARGVAPGRP